ncbi:hypothetical protein BH09BAC3_BH09BAC3_13250 [soil metagenome]
MNEYGVSTSCWYCSDENVKGHLDRQFNSAVAWDVPLLEGYPYRFFKNHAFKGSLYGGFFGLVNLGMINALFNQPKSVVVVHGWGYLTNILVIIFARLFGHVVCLRGESPYNQEMLKSKFNRLSKKIMLRYFLFQFVNRFLFIGTQNKEFYKYYGVKEHQLLFVPYAVDNDRFRAAAEKLSRDKNELRIQLGIPSTSKVILFSGKYIQKKRPMDLLMAYQMLPIADKSLVMVGDGEKRKEIEAFIHSEQLENVILTGFVNQTEIVKYYAAADVFVMCSGVGETWGLSVNEAMNFDLPLVVSDMTGCSSDLVEAKRNGFVSLVGDVKNLCDSIGHAIGLDGRNGKGIIDTYSFTTIVNTFKNNFQQY